MRYTPHSIPVQRVPGYARAYPGTRQPSLRPSHRHGMASTDKATEVVPRKEHLMYAPGLIAEASVVVTYDAPTSQLSALMSCCGNEQLQRSTLF